MKYNGIIYSHQVPENLKYSWKYEIFKHINKVENYFTNKTNYDAFCGNNKYSSIITFKYKLAYAQYLCLSWCVLLLLYGFPLVLPSIIVPQKCQHREKLGPMSKYWHPKI